ncbi:ALP1-like protein [Tanacetum coccineum]
MGEHMESKVTSPNKGDNDFLNDCYNVDATSSYETETELYRYLKELKIELRKGQSLDILQWWKVSRFPIVSKMARVKRDAISVSPKPPKNRSSNNIEPVFFLFRSMPRDDPIIERIPRRSLKKRNITPSKNELPHIGSNVAFEENMISRFNNVAFEYILAIQISIVASEAAFSTGGHVLDPYRTRLSTTIVEALICTQDWIVRQLLNLYSDKLRHDQKCKKMKLSQDMQLIQKLHHDQKRMKKVFEVMSGSCFIKRLMDMARFFGVSGSNNDINVTQRSPLLNDLKLGKAPEVPFVANDVTYPWGYYLCDGIYPEWVSFVKSVTNWANDDHKRLRYKIMHKATRKDVEW